MNDECYTGDLDSSAQGSGARKNEGKPQVDLIPLRVWMCRWSDQLCGQYKLVVARLVNWQEGGDAGRLREILKSASDGDLAETVAVFEFGAKKYKEWNWVKGMQWSVPTGCIIRHFLKIVAGEELDPESGLPHIAHILCNIIMLEWFYHNYPQGDNRPPVYDKLPGTMDEQYIKALLQREKESRIGE
jgi:hypothetical protein